VAPTSGAATTPDPTSSAPTTGATALAPSTGSSEQEERTQAVRGPDEPSGPSLSPLIGGGLMLALAAAAGTVAWRRRAGG